jgi:hypothetical protein
VLQEEEKRKTSENMEMSRKEELATLGHGGMEVVPADTCVRVVGMEVRWWCSLLFSSVRLCGFGAATVAGPDVLRCMFLWYRGGIAGGY